MPYAGSTSVVLDKRIAIVCGHFSPEIGYQEVDLARSFTRLGARVRILTSTRVSSNARTLVQGDYEAGRSYAEGYEIVRLTPRLSVGPNVLGCNVTPATKEFAPDQVILIGPGKLFGLELFSREPSPWRRIVVMQDNSEDGRAQRTARRGNRPRELAHRLVKRPAYRRVVRNADRIILNVPETRSIVEPWLTGQERELLAQKAIDLRLGFDPQRFFFDPTHRKKWRARHGVDDDELVLVTCTRATPRKKLDDVIDAVTTVNASGASLRYVLAGLLDDAYADSLRERVARQPDPSAFVLLPALRQNEMRNMFCACDLGFWPQAAITIQQAMGTGLPMVLMPRASVTHLLTPEKNGWYVGKGETLEEGLLAAVRALSPLTTSERLVQRENLAEFNATYLSYDVIALEMVDGL
jgi:glycosyltransferase involved in cell wall biosynthesis